MASPFVSAPAAFESFMPEVLTSPQIPQPIEAVEDVIEIERKHVLMFLGGLVVVGLVVFCGWEYFKHRLQSRRTIVLTDNAAKIASSVSQSLLNGTQFLREMRALEAGVHPVQPGPAPTGTVFVNQATLDDMLQTIAAGRAREAEHDRIRSGLFLTPEPAQA